MGYIKRQVYKYKMKCDECTVNRVTLGHHTWHVLHPIAESNDIHKGLGKNDIFVSFMKSLSILYPCSKCAKEIQKYILKYPPILSAGWMIDFHNDVNQRIGKPIWKPIDACSERKHTVEDYTKGFYYLLIHIFKAEHFCQDVFETFVSSFSKLNASGPFDLPEIPNDQEGRMVFLLDMMRILIEKEKSILPTDTFPRLMMSHPLTF